MPNRILRENVLGSEAINRLRSWFDEVFWYRLLVVCDDYGRFDGRPAAMRAALFPLALDRVSEKDVLNSVHALRDAGLVWVYEVNGRPYVEVTKWGEHQRLRQTRPKWPMPLTELGNGALRQPAANGGGLRPEVELESEYESEQPQPTAAFADAKSEQRPPLDPEGIQTYLLERLWERGKGWKRLTWRGLQKLNNRYGRPLVTSLLQDAAAGASEVGNGFSYIEEQARKGEA